ncbi:hypothetical protein OESDEN_22420 [Oesophagostomum dentatum]|uniref:Chitin synthase chs-1/2 N-terminal putative transporter domain-containing protein n=1 Tax=Oesophagostomum dentatum TaxID=61180 RepID=A0A0B1S3Z1_OESDE|nr:hypothetical protein OESDEN_22420 [Oesophagostomum dentatum]
MYLSLMLIQIVPDILTLIRSLTRFYRGDKAGRVRFTFVLLETLRAFGLSLLVFTVFPQLDLYRCLCLCACFPISVAVLLKGVWVLPLGLFSISIGFWESWVGKRHSGTAFHELFQVKYGLRRLNVSTRLMIAIFRIFIVVIIMCYAANGRVKGYLFFNVMTSFSLKFKQT